VGSDAWIQGWMSVALTNDLASVVGSLSQITAKNGQQPKTFPITADSKFKGKQFLTRSARCIMITFTVLGFVVEGGKYLDFNLDIFAESPMDAMEKALRQQSGLVVSGVCRAFSGRIVDY